MNARLLSHSRIARRRDPVTSHIAAAGITQSGKRATQQQEVMALVMKFRSRTSAELSALTRLSGPLMDRYTIARRLPELEAAGLVHSGAKRACTVTGHQALTWWPA